MPIIDSFLLPLGLKLLGAAATWIIGSWLISFVVKDSFKSNLFSKILGLFAYPVLRKIKSKMDTSNTVVTYDRLISKYETRSQRFRLKDKTFKRYSSDP